VLLIVQRVPLRGATMIGLKMAMWRSTAVGPAQHARAVTSGVDAWEGALALDIPAESMKSKRPFAPALMIADNVATEDQAGSPAHEHALRRVLLELWFIPNGGRDVCRTAPDPTTGRAVLHDAPWLFPDAGAPEEKGGRKPEPRRREPRGPRGRSRRRAAAPHQWTRESLSSAFLRAVLRHSDVLAVDPRALRQLRGAVGFHVVRRLFGTFWAPRNLVWTSRLLDHTSIEFTAGIYVAQDERTMSLDAAAHDAIAAYLRRAPAAVPAA
jgi:hypothetical protein